MLDTVFMRKPLRADLHIHSQYSDGSLSIAEIVDLYGGQGFDVIAITDHITEKKSFFGKISRKLDLSVTEESFQDYLQEVRIQRERALQKYGMNLIFGYEITKNSLYNNRSCHLLILGLEEYISPDLSVDEILAITDRRDCIVIAAHPFNTGEFEFQTFYLWSRREELKHQIDAWEVSYRKKISEEVLTSGLPLVASSDMHRRSHMASWKTKLFCDNELLSIKQCLRDKKTEFFYLDESNVQGMDTTSMVFPSLHQKPWYFWPTINSASPFASAKRSLLLKRTESI
jgi:3',5'-nucleoside bisphosphate phosphatase